jgi:clan AA aspartic protease (TIGR02281 family)
MFNKMIKTVTWLLKATAISSFTAAVLLIVVAYRPEPLEAQAQAWLKQSTMMGLISHAEPTKPSRSKLSKADETNWVFASIERLKSWMDTLPANTPTAENKAVINIPSRKGVTQAIVPMDLQPKALFVTAHINNRQDGHFILDTGATYMSISQEMAEELGIDLSRTEMVPITTANGKIEVPKVILKSVKVNGLEAKDVEATVMNFKKDASFSGLLGLSFINQFKLTIDPNKGQLLFEPLQTSQR